MFDAEVALDAAGYRYAPDYGGWLHDEKRIGVLQLSWEGEDQRINLLIQYYRPGVVHGVEQFGRYSDCVEKAIFLVKGGE